MNKLSKILKEGILYSFDESVNGPVKNNDIYVNIIGGNKTRISTTESFTKNQLQSLIINPIKSNWNKILQLADYQYGNKPWVLEKFKTKENFLKNLAPSVVVTGDSKLSDKIFTFELIITSDRADKILNGRIIIIRFNNGVPEKYLETYG